MEPATATVLCALVTSTLPFILKLVEERIKNKPDLESAVQFVQSHLQLIRAAIQDYLKEGKDSNMWRVRIKELTHLAYRIEDCIDSFVHQIERAGAKNVNTRRFAEKIEGFKTEAKVRHENWKAYIEGIQNQASESQASGEGCPFHPAAHDPMGKDDPLQELLDLVRESELETARETDKLKVISFACFDGLGGTLLVKEVYGSDGSDGKSAQVTATGKAAQEVLMDLLTILDSGTNAENNSNLDKKEVRTRLKSILGNNRYKILINDMPRTMQWKSLISAFPRTEQVDSKVLAYDYGYGCLPSSGLEDCLLYYCMLPHFCNFTFGHRVSRNALIRRWVAEGLVPAKLFAETRRHRTLIDRNIVQPIQASNDGNMKRCQASGMILPYIKDVSCLHTSIMCRDWTREEDGCEYPYTRRLSLHHFCAGVIPKSDGNLSHLRALSVFPRNNDVGTAPADFNVEFSEYKLLRVLDLEECDALENSHLDKICKELVLLKYLSLGGTISKVPRKIARLRYLETLDLRRSRTADKGRSKTADQGGSSKQATVKMPMEVIELPQLRHLLGKFQLHEGFHPLGLGKSQKKVIDFLRGESNLETLAGFVLGKGTRRIATLIAHMNKLKKVKIWCEPIAPVKDLKHCSEAIRGFGDSARLMPSRFLSIDVSDCAHSKDFLDSLHDDHRHMAFVSLKLRGKLTEFPRFVTMLYGITKLCLSSTSLRWQELMQGGLENLTRLKYLKLVEHDPGDCVDIKKDQLGSLERICLVGDQGLPDVKIHDQDLPHLASLHLLCQDRPTDISGINIIRFRRLALHDGVPPETKDTWIVEARHHPNAQFNQQTSEGL